MIPAGWKLVPLHMDTATVSQVHLEWDGRADSLWGDLLRVTPASPPQAEADELLERFPEINFSNYGQDEVEALQAWAFEAFDLISRGVK